MSMFHELMMRKKEQIMYATIKGSLTNNDGVISGFSTSNYLLTQDNIALANNQDFEIRIAFTTGGDVSSFKHLLETYGHPYDFYIDFKDDRFRFRFYDANNTSVIYTLWYSVATNTQYTLIWQYISATNTHNISLVQNGVVVASDTNISTIYSYNYPFAIGCSDIVSSIDLNNSYIKLGSTKYNLQAVVGYTIVGSPTITDGVVSGFSSSDYVHILNFPTTYDSIEFVTKVKANVVSENTSNSVFALGNGSLSQSKFYLYFTPQQVVFRYKSTDNTGKSFIVNYVSSANTFYYIRVRIYTNKIVLGISVDKNNWVEGEIADSIIMTTFSQDLRYGVITNNPWALDGSIDINETYIKINNKLWFNGQQA